MTNAAPSGRDAGRASAKRRRLALGLLVANTCLSFALAWYRHGAQPPRRAGAPARPPACALAPPALAVQPACEHQEVRLCQAFGPPLPDPMLGADGGFNWQTAPSVGWRDYAQGEYLGHFRSPHVPEYRLRVDDELELVFRVTHDETSRPYELNVGDEVRIESYTDPNLNADLMIQPDGTITLRLLGQVRASRRTVAQLREELERLYQVYDRAPAINVVPLRTNAKLESLRATVDSRQGFGGQSRRARVTPEGTIGLPAIGSVPAQGLTLSELEREINERYAAEIEGMEVTPTLFARAPRFAYVLGEVRTPGRFELQGPTTVMQAISLAGGWTVGGNLQQVVVFRRGDDWRLMATMLDLRGALLGRQPCPADEIWLNDSDIVVVPKSSILVLDDFIELVFARGIYGVMPFGTSYSFSNGSRL